jgi:hypothetical protein
MLASMESDDQRTARTDGQAQIDVDTAKAENREEGSEIAILEEGLHGMKESLVQRIRQNFVVELLDGQFEEDIQYEIVQELKELSKNTQLREQILQEVKQTLSDELKERMFGYVHIRNRLKCIAEDKLADEIMRGMWNELEKHAREVVKAELKILLFKE